MMAARVPSNNRFATKGGFARTDGRLHLPEAMQVAAAHRQHLASPLQGDLRRFVVMPIDMADRNDAVTGRRGSRGPFRGRLGLPLYLWTCTATLSTSSYVSSPRTSPRSVSASKFSWSMPLETVTGQARPGPAAAVFTRLSNAFSKKVENHYFLSPTDALESLCLTKPSIFSITGPPARL